MRKFRKIRVYYTDAVVGNEIEYCGGVWVVRAVLKSHLGEGHIEYTVLIEFQCSIVKQMQREIDSLSAKVALLTAPIARSKANTVSKT